MKFKGMYIRGEQQDVYIALQQNEHTGTVEVVCVDKAGELIKNGRILSIQQNNSTGLCTVITPGYINEDLPFRMDIHPEGGKCVLVKNTILTYEDN